MKRTRIDGSITCLSCPRVPWKTNGIRIETASCSKQLSLRDRGGPRVQRNEHVGRELKAKVCNSSQTRYTPRFPHAGNQVVKWPSHCEIYMQNWTIRQAERMDFTKTWMLFCVFFSFLERQTERTFDWIECEFEKREWMEHVFEQVSDVLLDWRHFQKHQKERFLRENDVMEFYLFLRNGNVIHRKT